MEQQVNQISSLFQDSEWYQAFTIAERLELLRRNPEIDSKINLAQKRIQKWRTQPPFVEDTYFAKRLIVDEMTEAEFQSLLGLTLQTIQAHCDFDTLWLAELKQAFLELSPKDALPLPPKELENSVLAGFLNVIEPVTRLEFKRLHEGISSLVNIYSYLPFNPDTVEAVLLADLPNHLLWILSRTLVLEMNVARIQNKLEGNTPEARFESYVTRLQQPATAIALLREYPVLARQVLHHLKNWVTYSLEFLQNLCADWQEIQSTFELTTDPGSLVEWRSGLGDKHRGGRSVCRATFSSGFKVIYKPRTLAVDIHFQELLRWLNDRGVQPQFQTINILSRENYGWMPFISSNPCTALEQIEHFFKRQGGYLALLYALEATDFHHENLIAAGEHPMLLDLEALFHPRVNTIKGMESVSTHWSSDPMSYSVMRVGLLPERIWSNTNAEGIDISGIGAVSGQLSPDRVLQWENVGTDLMYCTRKQVVVPDGKNRPLLKGVEVDVLEHRKALISGFINIYKLLLKHREALLASNGPLQQFSQDEVRIIIRPTRIYAKLLENSYHPDMLRDSLERELLLDRLWVGIEDNPVLPKTIPYERNDLANGDIPIFTTNISTCDLWSSTSVKIPNFFTESAMAATRRRIEHLSEADLEKQLWFIRASLTNLSEGVLHRQLPDPKATNLGIVANYNSLLEAAKRIADRLEALAFQSDQGISWIGLTSKAERYWSIMPLGVDLYSGLPGIALFFAYLGAVSGVDRYTVLAQTTLSTLLHRMKHEELHPQSIGAFTGWGGVIYVLSHLGALWQNKDLWAEAQVIAELLPGLIEQDQAFDIIDGSAGCLNSLISLYVCAPSEITLAAAKQCGERLVTCAQPMASGVGWVNHHLPLPLAGFAHGAAGIAQALFNLSELTGDKRFQATAQSALAYERSLFSPVVGNWVDLRESQKSSPEAQRNQPTCMTAWCHGAPGIGLARLSTLKHIDDATIRSEIDIAIKTMLAHGFSSNHSLCHGNLGNLELLLLASQTLDTAEANWQTIINNQVALILQDIEKQVYRCGVPLGVETPGLMTGIAGIGYELLRLAEPNVPSVLTLAPPP